MSELPDQRRPTVTLMVFTLNEIDGMKVIMPQVRREWVDQILVVDGQSTDGTAEWSREQGFDVHVQTRRGLRHAYNEAFPIAKGDLVVTFSPDGNSPPEAIPDLIRKVRDEGYDMVIASRYLEHARSHDDDFVTSFGNWLFTRIVNLLHGANYTDAMVIYRAYRRSLYSGLDLDKDEGYAPEKWWFTTLGIEPLLSVRAAKAGLKITEIPVDEPKRIGGERKLQIIRWGGAYLTQFFRELWHWRPKRKP